jgi:membrane protein YqaA with SNARE-associated domain
MPFGAARRRLGRHTACRNVEHNVGLIRSFFGYFLSPAGLFALGTLDSSLVFFLPFGVDAVLAIIVARHPEHFWIYPLIATAGSLVGAAFTYWAGLQLGEQGLIRFVSERKLKRLQSRVRERVAISTALLALIPPPFPFTPFLLVAGTFRAPRIPFFTALGSARLVRFFVMALLARRFGTRITAWMQSDGFERVIIGFIIVVLIGTAWSAFRLFRPAVPPRAAAAEG